MTSINGASVSPTGLSQVEPVARLNPSGSDPLRWQVRPIHREDGAVRGWAVWQGDQPISGLFDDRGFAVAAAREFRGEAIAMETREGGDAQQAPSRSDDSAAIAQSPSDTTR